MTKQINLPKDQLETLYKTEGHTIYQIAELFNCSPALVSKKFKTFGISTWWKAVNITKEQLERLYWEEKLSLAKIAKNIHCGQTTLVSKLHSFGILSRKKIILLSYDALQELYYNQKMEQKEIAAIFGCDQATISNKMREAGIKPRDKSEINTKYPKTNFSNDPTEKAYLIGFRLGDLHVRKHRNLLSVETTTTRQEQIELIKGLLGKYSHITTRKNKHGTAISCLLNKSFLFLLKKDDNIPGWILNNNRLFLSFLAGYTDAEGCIGIYKDKKGHISIAFILRTYDKNILQKTQEKLVSMGIMCPKANLCALKGTQNNNKDFWKTGVYKKKSLINLFVLLKPYVRHQRVIDGINRALQILRHNQAATGEEII